MRKVARNISLPGFHKEKLKTVSEARNKSMTALLEDALKSVTGDDLGKAIVNRYSNGLSIQKPSVTTSAKFESDTLDRLDHLAKVTGLPRDTIFQLVIEIMPAE